MVHSCHPLQVKLVVTAQTKGDSLYGECVPVEIDLRTSLFSQKEPCEKFLADHAGLPGGEIPQTYWWVFFS